MTFGGSGGGGGSSISGSTDVALSNPANDQVLTYNTGVAKWQNAPSQGGTPTLANLPAGSTITVHKVGGNWPGGDADTGVRPTSRSDITVMWKGPDPSPAIVSSGTGGMLDNVDIRLVTP